MKLIKTFFIGAALVSLSACSGGAKGTAVSKQQFQEEAVKTQERQYSKAVVSYKAVNKDSSDKSNNVNESGKINFTFKDGSFELDANQKVPEDIELEGYVGGRVTELIVSVPGNYDVKYYKAPLGVEYELVVSGKASYSRIYGYMQFNENGYLVKGVVEAKNKTTVEIPGVAKTTVTTETKSELNISYQ